MSAPYLKRKEVLHIFGFDRNGTKTHATVGITGCTPGIGVTHLAVSLCNFCASKLKLRCALLELHARDELSALCSDPGFHVQNAADGERPRFTLHRVDYYPRVRSSEIPSLLNRGYDYLILDMGALDEADVSEFLRCDRKLVYGSLAPWKLRKYEAFFEQFDHQLNLGEGFCYLVQTGNNETLSLFSREHHIRMQSVPHIDNPFRIDKDLFLFFSALLSAGDRARNISRIL